MNKFVATFQESSLFFVVIVSRLSVDGGEEIRCDMIVQKIE
ncbi:hypothetical protein RINTHM_4180 [Richelia intracellularis HM01]|nr:hypothetical protein RINTHM_4180 [Richelia intracellularis HM01]